MARKKTRIPGPIPSIHEAWETETGAYAGEDIEALLKSEIGSKFGDFYVDDSVDACQTIYFFENESAKSAWLDDRSDMSLVLKHITFNVASMQGEGTVYVVQLAAEGVGVAKYTNTKKLLIPMRFTCRKATTIAGNTTSEDLAGTTGTIVVSAKRAGSNGNFQTLTASDGQPRYMDAVPLDSTGYRNFDLGPYLQDGEWNYRITVIEPQRSTVSSAVAVNVTLSESMGLQYAGDLGHVFTSDSITLPFYVLGSVDRKLHIEILNAAGNTVLATPEPTSFLSTQGGGETTQNITITRSQFNFRHGVYRIHTWLTFAGDTAGTRIDDQTFGVMYSDGESNDVLVAVSDAITEANNYDTVSILRYAVYNPSGDDYDLTLSVIDGINGDVVYHSEDVTCSNETSYIFQTMLNCQRDELGDFNVLVRITRGSTVYYSGVILLSNDMDFSPRGTANLTLNPSAKVFSGTDKRGNSFTFDFDNLNISGQPAGNLTNIKNPSIEGLIRENNVDRFRLLRGSVLDLPFEMFTNTTGLKVAGVDYSMTAEFDIEVTGIVDESASLISCYAPVNNSFVGLKATPNRIVVLGVGQGPISTPDMADYYLEESKRMHIAVNIVNNLRNEGLNYMRIFVDGVMQREYTYPNTTTSPFCASSGTNGHLLIGGDGCNVDIYGIRIMLDQSLSSSDIQQDYKASMSSIDQKRAFVAANDAILAGDRISYEKAKEIYNTILYELPAGSTFPTFNSDPGSINNVRMTVLIIGDDKHSGVFSSCEIKRQGSTAKKYFWPNISSKLCKADSELGIVKGTFTSVGVDPDTNLPWYNGTSYYQLDDNQPKSKKWVGKSNYASPMQSHKMGATAAFNDLHRRCALPDGGFTYDKHHPGMPSRRAVLEKPFLCFFTDDNHPTPTFCGFQTWGAAKGDKPTFGYDDDSTSASYTPDYIMVEGADNNVPGANFETPWIPSEMTYDNDEESFCYNGAPNFDYDLGCLNDDETYPAGGAITSINSHLIPAFNMVYLHNPNLRPFNGGLAALNQAYQRDKNRMADENNTEPLELESNVHYWCCNSTNAEYCNVYRMDYLNDVWVDAGLTTLSSVDENGFNRIVTTQLNLKTQLGVTDNDLLGMTNEEKNEAFIQARVQHFKAPFEAAFDKSDALFHQCFIKLFAGTDNRAKNTYYWIEGGIDHKIRFDGDDLDTILKTDNKGQQSKPYWILEEDKDELNAWYWNGRDNALFRLIEMAYEDDMRTMMRNIFNAMAAIAGSVDAFFQRYFFSTQEYFPAVAYNETARLLYETAQLYYDGIRSREGARPTDWYYNPEGKSYGYKEMPITQSLGNQLHAEREYMSKRLPLMQSYANYGVFSLNGQDSITFTSTGSSTYNIRWTAYQDIYPVAAFGQALDYGTDQYGVKHTSPWRMKAGETCTFVTQMSGETTVAIHGMSYCSEIGNLGANAIKGNLRLTGRRLRDLMMPKISSNFMPSSIVLSSDMSLEVIDWHGITFEHSSPSFDFSRMTRLQSLDLSGCSGVTEVVPPKTSSLHTLKLPDGLKRLEICDMPALSTFSIDGIGNMENVLIDNPVVDSKGISSLLLSDAPNLQSISIKNINWVGLATSHLMWFADMAPYNYGLKSEHYTLTGKATVDQSQLRINCDYKRKLIEVFGNIDASSGVPLSLTYDKYQINGVTITGPSYISKTGIAQFGFTVSPPTSNNINIVVDENGVAHEDVLFGFVGANGQEIVPVQFCNWQDAVKGLLNVINTTTEEVGTQYTLRVRVNTNAGNQIREITNDMLVGFYLRHPKVGDFAYADGTFDDLYNKNKTYVGIVFKIDPIYQGQDDLEPIVFMGYNKPSQQIKETKSLVGYRVLVDCKERAAIKSFDGTINTSSLNWGLYGVSFAPLYGNNTFGKICTVLGVSSVEDVNNLKNFASTGYGNKLSPSNYLSDETEDGFKDYSTSQDAVNDWNGKTNTTLIVNHMRTVFNRYLMSEQNQEVLTSWYNDNGDGTHTTYTLDQLPTNTNELGDACLILQKANGNEMCKQFMYGTSHACYLYEPSVNESETLDLQYKKTNWYLPALGELARLYVFASTSSPLGFVSSYGDASRVSISSSVVDNMITQAYNSETDNAIKQNVSAESIATKSFTNPELCAINKYFHSLTECNRPIYSMAMWRMQRAGVSAYATRDSNYYWSSTENGASRSYMIRFYNSDTGGITKNVGYVAHPIVAFTFML